MSRCSWELRAKPKTNWLLGLLYPPKCALCETLGVASPCDLCRSEMALATPHELEGLDSVTAAFAYEGRAGQAVRKLKYSRSTSLAPFMAAELATIWNEHLQGAYDLCTPIPIHWRRRTQRGFNQSDLLSEAIPPAQLVKTLKRIRSTTPQVKLSREARTQNLKGAFRSVHPVEGKRILLIDDVATTGSTARECALTLKAAGATKVGLLVFAQEV